MRKDRMSRCRQMRGSAVTEQRSDNLARLSLIRSGATDTEALIAIVRRLSVAQSLPEIMDIVTYAARAMLEADGITFVLREGDLCHYAEEDAISPLWKGRRFPMSACISGWCMIEKRAAVIRDITKDPRIPQEAYRETFVRSLAMVPVRQDDPVAAMGAYWSWVREAGSTEVELLQAVANAAGLALIKVELEREREKVRKAQGELSHRLRNMLSIVQSIARQSFRSAETAAEAQEIFSRRLSALAHSQMLLLETGEGGADLHSLIREQLIIDGNEQRFICQGPRIFLGADEAFELGLVLHELGTNARKYGALSRESGTVRIEWQSEKAADRRMVRLVWAESGGPPVSHPDRKGFGSALLHSAFKQIGGEVTVEYESRGLTCLMHIPLE
jgi:two-component sensor histidine kinase